MARLYLDAGQTYGIIGPFSPTDVIGTNGNETVIVDTNGKANFDPSFNRGGDEIVIQGTSGNYSGALSGSTLLISNDNGAAIRIPVGREGATITFSNGSFELILANNQITLGDQVITANASTLNGVGESEAAPLAALATPFVEDTAPPAADFAVHSNYLFLA